jgi:hypothetical protein
MSTGLLEARAIGESGEVVERTCLLHNYSLDVPATIFDEFGKVRGEFLGTDLSEHGIPGELFISQGGNCYCRRRCWSLYCED